MGSGASTNNSKAVVSAPFYSESDKEDDPFYNDDNSPKYKSTYPHRSSISYPPNRTLQSPKAIKANPERVKPTINPISAAPTQKTSVSRESDIFESVSRGDMDELAALLESQPSLLWATTSTDLNYYISNRDNIMETFHHVNLLHLAAEKGEHEAAKLLLDKGIKVDDVCERKGKFTDQSITNRDNLQ